MRDIPSIEYAACRCGNYGFVDRRSTGVFSLYPCGTLGLAQLIIGPRLSCTKAEA
jgi:hypothetical protein